MVLRGLVLLCSLAPFDSAMFSCPRVERRVWSYGVCFRCAPSLPSILPYSFVLMVEGRSLV